MLREVMLMSYPAVFKPEEHGGYLIEFPDFGNIYTGVYEDDIPFGVAMAEEALGLGVSTMIEEQMKLPNPSHVNEVAHESAEFVTLITIDVDKYLKDNQLVKKTLTIPYWANEVSKRYKFNLSKLLTNAIFEESNKK